MATEERAGQAPPLRARSVIVHDLVHARAALAAAAELGVGIVLRSAPDAAAYLGAGAFLAIVEAARRDHPHVPCTAVLDCGDAPGHALGALRIGLKAIRLRAPPDVLARVGDIAAQHGAVLDDDSAPALDLLDHPDAEAACRAWLGGGTVLPARR